MNKPEEFLKKDLLIKKYSNKPIPKFLKYIGKIKELNEYDSWIKETNKILINWFLDYLIILPFIFYFCLTAWGITTKTILLALGGSLTWYLFLSLIKDIRGAIKNE